jgi:hypothetical protein
MQKVTGSKLSRILGWLGLATAAAQLLGGCASPVALGEIKAFGAAATAVSSTLEKSKGIQRDLAAKTKTELEAARYVAQNPSFVYPPGSLPTKSLAANVWTPRVQFLKALAGYSQALADLEDPDNGARAEKGVASLQAAVLSFQPGGGAASFIDPVGSALQTIVRVAVIQHNAVFARQTIARAHPWIEEGVQLLKADFALLSKQTNQRYQTWLEMRRGHLRAFAQDSNAKKTALYKSYRDFVQENDELFSALVLLLPDQTGKPGYIEVLDALVTAHAALREEKPDPAAISDFLALVEKLVAIAKIAQA